MPDKNDHEVLKGHVPQGNKYVPKILAAGQLREVPYVRIILPELIWLAVLNRKLGTVATVKVLDSIASAVKRPGPQQTWFGAISCFLKLPPASKHRVLQELQQTNLAEPVAKSLAPLIDLYPEFPGAFLITEEHPADRIAFIGELKLLLNELFDTESASAVFMCANAVHVAFCLRILKVNSNTSLAQFPEIENYPSTDLSRRVGASCRSAALQLVDHNIIQAGLTGWSSYFWNRNLEIEPIDWGAMGTSS